MEWSRSQGQSVGLGFRLDAKIVVSACVEAKSVVSACIEAKIVASVRVEAKISVSTCL